MAVGGSWSSAASARERGELAKRLRDAEATCSTLSERAIASDASDRARREENETLSKQIAVLSERANASEADARARRAENEELSKQVAALRENEAKMRHAVGRAESLRDHAEAELKRTTEECVRVRGDDAETRESRLARTSR